MSSEISEVVAGQVNERFLEVPTNSIYFNNLATLNASQTGAQNPFDALVREMIDVRVAETFKPTVAIAESIPRAFSSLTNGSLLVSGRQGFSAVHLVAGTVVTSITFCSATTALATGTNQWFSLYDSSRNLLAVTADDTSTAWAANTLKTLNLSSPYTVATTGLYYLGICVAASTVPSLAGKSDTPTAINGLAPVLAGVDGTNTGLTTPATAPATAAVLTASGFRAYAYVS